MKTKLNAMQIGHIALHVEASLKEHEVKEPDITVERTESEMEPWELLLKEKIDNCPALPNYEDERVTYWVEVLIEYFCFVDPAEVGADNAEGEEE